MYLLSIRPRSGAISRSVGLSVEELQGQPVLICFAVCLALPRTVTAAPDVVVYAPIILPFDNT